MLAQGGEFLVGTNLDGIVRFITSIKTFLNMDQTKSNLHQWRIRESPGERREDKISCFKVTFPIKPNTTKVLRGCIGKNFRFFVPLIFFVDDISMIVHIS